jgi:AhpD family alkylhydroperoxidase
MEVACCLVLVSSAAQAKEMSEEATATLADIKSTLGFVPSFFRAFPQEGIAGAWDEFKAIQLNPKSAVPAKYKELIGLGIASQIPCEYCVYFHTRAARANGATEREIKEAIAMSAIVRHWSTFINGAQVDEALFKKELEQVIQHAKANTGHPAQAITVTDAKSAREDIRQTLGLVPSFYAVFPDSGVAGAWKEMKNLQLNPNTAIPPKYKELIGLGVAAQIPCRYCSAFHTQVSTQLLGATTEEVHETLALAGIVRHWSTFLNGLQIDKAEFRSEVDKLMAGPKKAASKHASRAP